MVMDQKATMSQHHRQTSKRSSYFETLSSLTSQLDFMREDLSSSHAFEFAPMSPLDLGSNLQVQTADLLCGKMHRQPRPLQQRGTLPGYDIPPGKETMVTNQPANSDTKVYSDVFQFPSQPLTPREQEPVEEMTLRSRIVHSRLVWYLPRIYRAAAVHYLQGQPTGTFIVRSSSRPGELCLSMRHPGTAGGAFIEHFNIIALPNGYRLDREEEVFNTLDDLVLHHCTNRGSLPCPLDIPQALKTAHTRADLQSLAILEEEFWKSPHSRIPSLQQSSDKSARPGSTAFMLTIQRTSSSEAGDLMDTRETKDRILSMYGTESKGNTNRHSWSSNTSGNSHEWNKLNYGHRKTLSDANRQIMRYSNEVEPFDMSYLQRPPPPNSPPPLPPVDAQLSYFVDPSHQDCAVISRTNGRSAYKQLRTLSSEGSSVRSQSTISEDSMGRDSICSSSSLSSHSRQSNSSLPDPLSRLSEHFPYQQPQVSSQDSGGALIEESPYSVPKVRDVSPHGATDRDNLRETFDDETLDLLEFSTLELSGGYKQPVDASSTLSEFDPLLVVAPPPEFGDDADVDISSREASEQSGQFSTAEVSENILVSFDSDGNVHLNSVEFTEDINIPSSPVTSDSFNNVQHRNSDLSGLFSVPTLGNSPLQRDNVDIELLVPSSSSFYPTEHQLTATRCYSEEINTVRGVDCISSEFAVNSSQSTSTLKESSSSELSDRHSILALESSPVKTGSDIQRSSSELGSPHHAISQVITGSGSQRSSDLSGRHNIPHHERSPVKTGSDSQRSSSDLSGRYNSSHRESSPHQRISDSQRSSSDLSGRYNSPHHESSPVKTGSGSQRSSLDLSGRHNSPHHGSSPVKTGSDSQRSSSDLSGRYNSSHRESSPHQRISDSQRSSSDLSGRHNSPHHESSPVKTGNGSQRSSLDLSGRHNSPHHGSSPVKTGSDSQRSSSDLSGRYNSSHRESSPVKAGSVSQRSSSELSGRYNSSHRESSPGHPSSGSQCSSSDLSGRHNSPYHESSTVKPGSGSQQSSSDLSGRYHSPHHESSPVKTGSDSHRSSSELSGRHNSPLQQGSPDKPGSGSQRSSSDLSGRHNSPYESLPIKPGSCSQRSSSDVSERYQSLNQESTLFKTDSVSQRSSADLSGKYNVPHHDCSPVRTGRSSQRSSSELSGIHNSPYLENSPVKSGSSSQRSSSDLSGRYSLPSNEMSPVTAPCNVHRSSSEMSGKYDSPTHETGNRSRPCSNRSGGMYSIDTSTGTPFIGSHEASGVDRSSSEFSVEDKVSDSENALLDSNAPHIPHQSGSDFSGDFDIAESVSLPVSICEADDDDEEEEALKIQAAKMKRCVSLPSALIRGTSEGVFHGSKSAMFFEGVPEDESVGEEGFEFVSHPEWNSENANSNRSLEESSGTPKSKKGKTFRQIKHMAKKSTKKVHRKIRPSWNKKLEILDPAASIQEVVKRLAADPGTQLGAMVDSFISSTVDKCETQLPDAVLKSLRQFMSGVKNYLFNDQEKEVEAQLDKYCNLTGMEVDAIFEGALHQILLEPLKDQIYLCFIKHFNQSESLKLLDRNIRSAKEKSPEELGIRDKFTPPSAPAMLSIKERFMDIQKAFSPLQKLEYLLHVVREIYSSVSNRSDGSAAVTSMGADDFLPMLIYVLVHCDQIHIEIEVEYMWGLLDPSLLSGEGGYYLTVLSSAICVLKQFEEETECETKGFVTVFVARSSQPGDIVMKTVPVLPAMTAVEVSLLDKPQRNHFGDHFARQCTKVMGRRRGNVIIQKLNLDSETPHHIFLLDQGQEKHLESHCCIFKIKTDHEAVSNTLCKFCIRAENVHVTWPVISSNVQASI